MTDRDIIAWARSFATACDSTLSGSAEMAAKLRRLAELAEKGSRGWQPIATAPRGPRVLLLGEEDHIFTGQVADCIGPMDDHGYPQEATHWIPLPAPPGAP